MEYECEIVRQNMINDTGPIEYQDEIQWPTGDVLIRVPKQPERSKREDFVECNCKILDRAIKRAHSEGAWDQDDFDIMHALVQETKMRCSEHGSNIVREVQ